MKYLTIKDFYKGETLKERKVTDRKASECLNEFCRDSCLLEVCKNYVPKRRH